MLFDDEQAAATGRARNGRPTWITFLALVSCAAMLVMLTNPARAETTLHTSLLDAATVADQRILLGLLMIAFAVMSAGSLSFWRRGVRDLLRAGDTRRGR